MKTLAQIIAEGGGPVKIASTLNHDITPDAVRKWVKNGVPDRYWSELASVTGADIPDLFAANELLRAPAPTPQPSESPNG